MLVELNCTKQANYHNPIMANFQGISQECGNFSLRILLLLLQQLGTYDSGSGQNIETPAGVDSGTPVCVHLWSKPTEYDKTNFFQNHLAAC